MAHLVRPNHMRRILVCAVAATIIIPHFSFGQGSAAGYGQSAGGPGGFGGGGLGGFGTGGNMGGDEGDYNSKAADKQRAVDVYSFFLPDQQPAWFQRSAILTPGDKVEFKFDVKKGDAIVARVASDAFDPALELVDPTGKVVAKNDDRMEGDQSPFLLSKCELDGVYRLNVVSFRSVAGGKFELKARHFSPVDITHGKFAVDIKDVQTQSGKMAFLRFQGKKDMIFAPTQLLGYRDQNVRDSLQVIAILGPSGDFETDLDLLGTVHSGAVVRTKLDGDYYIMVRHHGDSTSARGQLNLVPVLKGNLNGDNLLKFGPNEHVIVQFPVITGKVVEIYRKPNTGVEFLLDAPDNEKADRRRYQVDSDPMRTVAANYVQFNLSRRDMSRNLHSFRNDGFANYIYYNYESKAKEVNIHLDDTLEAWRSGESQSDTLAIGESKFFVIDSKKSEIMRVKLTAQGFMPRLDIYSMEGDRLNSLFNPMLDFATDDLYFKKEAKFLVRVSCDGFGGSGRFELRRDSFATTPYKLSSSISINLDGSNFGLYEVQLEAGKRYELLVDSQGKSAQIDLIDQQGTFLRSTSLFFDGINVHYFVPAVNGPHRLWIRGAPGNIKFQMKLHGRPVIGELKKP